jgi:alginate O-acetyltransferase complex protein AlgI
VYFNSPVFLFLFLPVVLAGYYLVPAVTRVRGGLRNTLVNAILFTASIYFYAWGEKEYVQILLGSLVVNYTLARLVTREQGRGRTGRPGVVSAACFNLGLLGYFKYAGFVCANLSPAWEALGGSAFSAGTVHLPIGISFFSFQAMSYVIDVYRKDVPAERSLLRFGLYVFLFPHLIAGPIVRYRDIAGQLAHRPANLDQFAEGVKRLVAGLGKKLLIADTLAVAADAAFKVPPGELALSGAWLGLVCYALQIYFDFSGYSDMAIGLGKLFGFDFLENFLHPYAAATVTDFWRRWHISLSSWFRDYVYIPLGGNRAGPVATYRNLLVVFLLCGIWHGANWTFVAWGAWHGLFLIVERLGLSKILDALPRPARHGYTLLAVLGGWVFFRAASLGHAGGYLAALAGFGSGSWIAADMATNAVWVALAVGLVACMPVLPLFDRAVAGVADRGYRWITELALTPVTLAALGLVFVGACAAMVGSTYSSFIYFRF